MARHSLFPNSITINYTSNGHAHKQVLPIALVVPSGDSWNVTLRDDSAIDWTAAVDSWVTILQPFFGTADSIDSAELFDYEATDGAAIFLASYSIGAPGTSVSAVVPWSQIVFPFKALGGTSLRLTLVEQVNAVDLKNSFGAETDARLCDLMTFILSDDDFIITRGGTYPTSSLGYTTKENDKLRKRYFLN